MGRPEIEVPEALYVYGGDCVERCRECQLPCQLDVTSPDCFRRFFLQGLLQCTYFVHGYCFLIEQPGCVFDNGGEHDKYWLKLLNSYFHNVDHQDENDPDFTRHAEEVRTLVNQRVENREVSLCRYFEEVYNRVMEDGGGLSEEMMGGLDDAFLSLLAGTSRKS